MDQHLAHGDQLDRRSRLPHDRCYLLRAGRFQGPAIPGQQDFGWTGRGTDDYLSVEVKEVQFQGWWENESKTGNYDLWKWAMAHQDRRRHVDAQM
jgi:hypothetical protein